MFEYSSAINYFTLPINANGVFGDFELIIIIIKNSLFQFINNQTANNHFNQTNLSCKTSIIFFLQMVNVVKNYLNDVSILTSNWLPRDLDFNPIKLVCYKLARRICYDLLNFLTNYLRV